MLKNRWPEAEQHYHQWIEFNDANGRGYAEPEVFIVLKECVFLVECKRTGGVAGQLQLTHLYAPLLEFIYKRPVRCLLVCKWSNPGTPGPFYNSPEAFLTSGAAFGTWQWLPQP